ncbi:AEC family transporter [Oceanibacterium hippocampi]|uniref:Membrane transport protein n=1 Tax=Oceanibacterium hippocampi TaxID=745714 RepID=A0A1Y5SPL2_9PROT|nr:AEC family transporter [Oceanibacterium hippocampi]SLN44255.1 Membrane transport protein [Oceanibacterium hippocampi]
MIAALVPVFIMILLGWLLRRYAFGDESFWAMAERITYFVFFPALLVNRLGHADLSGFQVLPLAGAMILAVIVLWGLALLVARPLGLARPGASSLVQGAIRFNTYVGFAAASALWGTAGLTLAAIVAAIMIPTVNVISVIALTGRQAGLRQIVLSVVRNPLILACLIGAGLSSSGTGIPALIQQVLEILGAAALPLGLLAVGAALDYQAAAASKAAIVAGVVLKLLVFPAVMALSLHLFGVQGLTAGTALLWASLPVASSAYVMSRMLGGDARLMAGIITASTVAALVSMPAVLLLLG